MPLTEAPGAGRLVDVGDTRLFVVEKSLDGPPLVCLHGGPGLDHWSFGDYLDPLAADLRLILVDLRGHGMSEEVPRESLTVADMAHDVARLAEELELRDFALLGHSFGGFVALRVALDHRAGLKALVLVSTAAAVPDARAAPDLARVLAARPAGEEAMRRAVEAAAPSWFADADGPYVGEWLRKLAPSVLRPDVLLALAETDVDPGLADRLAEVDVPVVVVGGRHDRGCTVAASEALATAIPGARLAVFEESGHLPFVEEQERFLDVVRRFVLDRR